MRHTVAHDLFLSSTVNKGIKMDNVLNYITNNMNWLWLIMDILLDMDH